jgi:lysophospholipase L1-like esterase
LAAELETIAREYSVLYFDAGAVTEASLIDGIHLDDNQHQILGMAIADALSGSSVF